MGCRKQLWDGNHSMRPHAESVTFGNSKGLWGIIHFVWMKDSSPYQVTARSRDVFSTTRDTQGTCFRWCLILFDDVCLSLSSAKRLRWGTCSTLSLFFHIDIARLYTGGAPWHSTVPARVWWVLNQWREEWKDVNTVDEVLWNMKQMFEDIWTMTFLPSLFWHQEIISVLNAFCFVQGT